MSAKFESRKKTAKKRFPVLTTVLLVVVLLLGAALGTLLLYPGTTPAPVTLSSGTTAPTAAPQETAAAPGAENPDAAQGTEAEPIVAEVLTETEPAAPTDPVVSGNGIATSVQCKSVYTGGSENAAAVVATAGDFQLTNQALQIFYAAEVEAYRSSGAEAAPNFEWPLENQACPLTAGLSWQHYFLEQAVKSWQNVQALILASQQPQPVTDKGYQFLDYLHAEYVPENLPVNDFIFIDRPNYTPNETHQAYLDNLSNVLAQLAAQQGCTAEALVQEVFGSSVSVQNVLDAAREYNLAYMYFTEKSFGIDPSDEEVGAYLNAHITELSGTNVPTVNLRHLLLIPEGASVAADGTVTAGEAQWAACMEKAADIRADWKKDFVSDRHPEGSFGQLVSTNSADLGSKLDGGYYQNIEQGQLTSALDTWCFAPERKAGDVEILRSDVGVHIVFFCGSHTRAELAAREGAVREQLSRLWQEYTAAVPLNVDYSKVSLWTATDGKSLGLGDLLYPDIAHERFPNAITYLQQDFYYYRWGGSTVGQGGCGITTFSMLSTYMTDSLQTPSMMADRYAAYFADGGTNADIFRFAVGDLGYYLEEITYNLDTAVEALKKGQRVISLQVGGHFTSKGHYLLLQRYNEDGTFQLRDSNIYNYLRLRGHQIDAFTRDNILSGGTNFWIMQKKIVTIPACTRCGGDYDDHGPEALLNADYLCEKCTTALTRRNAFRNLVGNI